MTVLHVAGASGGMQEGGGRVPELEIVKKNIPRERLHCPKTQSFYYESPNEEATLYVAPEDQQKVQTKRLFISSCRAALPPAARVPPGEFRQLPPVCCPRSVCLRT